MTDYDTLELANYGSTPILLFTFARGTVVWRYCNQDQDIVAGGFTWLGLDTPISIDGNKQTGDPTQDAINFSVPSNSPMAALFTDLATSGGILANVQRVFMEDLNDLRPFWSGKITDRKITDPSTYQLVGQIQTYTGNTQGVRLREGRGCTYLLYQQFNTCMIDKELYRHTTTITDMDGASVTVADLPQDVRLLFYAGGFVQYEYMPGIIEQRGILLQDANNPLKLQLLGGTAGIKPTMSLDVFPGCPRDWDNCGTLYNNQDNYGGDPVFPGVSPFTTSIFQSG
jgi:hypothetical protein